jgi:pepF/M3 family oligoendopeptidase
MSSSDLPHWDMSVVFPGLASPEFESKFDTFTTQITELEHLFDTLAVRERSETAPTQAAFETIVGALNPLLELSQTLQAYINSFVATDSRNAIAQARLSEYLQTTIKLRQLSTRLTAWLGSFDLQTGLAASETVRTYQYLIQTAQIKSRHLLPPGEEDLVAELSPSGGSAWGRLYNDLTSQIAVPLEVNGQTQTLPISAVRNLAYAADETLRQAAYEAELAAWQANAIPLTAAMNSIKGQVLTLAHRRGWQSPLDAALFDNGIDHETLDAMLQAAAEYFPDFRRYLQTKARLLGQERLPWYNLFAPVGQGKQNWSYAEARELIITQFGAYSDRMANFAARAFRENWIDAEPRPAKQDGAFCMRLRRDESRILSNFQPGFKSALTLAHELGHAYHNLNLARQPMLNRETPMVLAETASIFCETIVRKALLNQVAASERLGILEASLVNATQIVVDISSRFLFEQTVFDQRRKRDLSTTELCHAMVAAQRETYGDGLDPEKLHPYMWAAKSHYYSAGRSYYNYPYMFGLLFGLGLYARYQQSPADFKQGYDTLLSSTGQTSAAALAGQMGIEIHSPDFWRSSLEIIKGDIDQFAELVTPS